MRTKKMSKALIAAGIAFSALAQVSIKYSARFEPWKLSWILVMTTAAIFYGASFLAYSFILRAQDLARTGPLMTVSVMTIAVLAGVFLFGEKIGIRQGIGIILALAAVILLAGKGS